MQTSDELLSSFDTSSKAFSAAWKEARAKASEKSIHDLRVSTRRLIATLELTQALSKNKEIAELQRRFKKVLKRMGPLRDVQVQLENVSEFRQDGPIVDFRRALQRRERREIKGVRGELHRRTKERLTDGIKDVRSQFVRLHEKLGDVKVHQTVERILKSRENEFLKARRRFKPADEETLHNMRIALKKLRYAVEAAQPLLGNSAKARARDMHAVQQLLGETRDVELLLSELQRWASKKGKTIAIVPALDRLAERRESLLKQLSEAAVLEKITPSDKIKPTVEKTSVVTDVAEETPQKTEV
jgi:CHAD domain-containing protein